MRNLTILTLALLTVTSCSKTDVVGSLDGNNDQIKFIRAKDSNGSSTLGKTSADALNTDTFGVFSAYESTNPEVLLSAGIYLDDQKLAHDGSGWNLHEGTNFYDVYYPLEFDNIYFLAYGNTYGNITPNFDLTGSYPIFTYADFNLDDYTSADLEDFTLTLDTIMKINTDNSKAESVQFQLTHPLTKLKFTASTDNGIPTAYTKITALKVTVIETANFSENAWTFDTGAAAEEKTISIGTDELTTTAADLSTADLYLIPGQDVKIDVVARIYLSTNDIAIAEKTGSLTYTWAGDGNDVFDMNNSVTLNISVSETASKIVFGTPQVDAWTPTDGGAVDVPTT